MEQSKTRPTKKQHELLEFVEKFITERGYGPSYREIMDGCNYSSVATVALHVNNLTKKGCLRKNGRSARSLEVVKSNKPAKAENTAEDSKEKWLLSLIEVKFTAAQKGSPQQKDIEELECLVEALKLLGFESNAQDFTERLNRLKQKP